MKGYILNPTEKSKKRTTACPIEKIKSKKQHIKQECLWMKTYINYLCPTMHVWHIPGHYHSLFSVSYFQNSLSLFHSSRYLKIHFGIPRSNCHHCLVPFLLLLVFSLEDWFILKLVPFLLLTCWKVGIWEISKCLLSVG